MKKNIGMITIILVVTILTFSIGTYAYFSINFQDERTIENSTNLNTELLSDTVVVSNVEDSAGSFMKSDIYPGHKEVASIKVTVSGKKDSKIGVKFIYDVIENGLKDHVKVSIYKSKSEIKTTNNYFECVKQNETIEKETRYFEACQDKNLELLISETTLNGGKEKKDLVVDTVFINENNKDVTYYYYAVVEFLNKESSQNEVMNKTLNGNILVEATMPEYKTFEESVVMYGLLGNNIAKSMLYSSYLDEVNLAYDETVDNNLRYIGATPNNYVDFNGEKWRIIGVMNNVEDGKGNKSSRIKLIRNDIYSFNMKWDATNSNDWSKASGQQHLNSTYINSINEEFQNMISNVLWNNVCDNSLLNGVFSPSNFMKCEKAINNYWLGKVGLMYVSDYGYATSGGETIKREVCLRSGAAYRIDILLKDCVLNNWLNNNTFQWTLTVFNSDTHLVYDIADDGTINSSYARNLSPIRTTRPVVYLKNQIKIISGEGTSTNPYKLEMAGV